jgi:hypothetical protein
MKDYGKEQRTKVWSLVRSQSNSQTRFHVQLHNNRCKIDSHLQKTDFAINSFALCVYALQIGTCCDKLTKCVRITVPEEAAIAKAKSKGIYNGNGAFPTWENENGP